MKKLFSLLLLAFVVPAAYAQQPGVIDVEAVKRAKVHDMLMAKANGGGGNSTQISGMPEQDCIGAIVVCQPIYYQPNSYEGEGNIQNEIYNNGASGSCLGAGELNSVWYKIMVVNDGFLGFNIIPNSPSDDYDWAVYNLTNSSCGQIPTDTGMSLEVSCDFSGSTTPSATTGPNGGLNNQDEPLIPVYAGEVYYIIVSNFSSTQSGYSIDFSPSTIELGNCSFIYGSVYLDVNTNCDLNPTDTPLAGQVVYALPGPYYSMSDANGLYSIGIPSGQTGTYQLFTQPMNASVVAECPVNPSYLTVNVTNTDSLYPGNNFAYVPNPTFPIQCPILNVYNSSFGFVLACCGNSRTVYVCNDGNATATNVMLDMDYSDGDLVFDGATLQGSVLPYTQNGLHYYFSLPDLTPGTCVSIDITEHAADPTAINEFACVTAHVTPDDPCGPPPTGWDGSDITISSACNNGNVTFYLSNNTVNNMQAPLNYTVYQGADIIDQGTYQLNAYQNVSYTYPADGDFFVMQAQQSYGNPSGIQPTAFVENCGDTTFVQTVNFNNFNQGQDEAHSIDTDCITIGNSYDPNDKQAVPAGIGPQHFISGYDKIEYKIRFQNTGTAPAMTVVLRDTLDFEFLEPQSLDMGVSNYEYTADLEGTGVLVITFNNINLPPASTDSLGSIGYVTYRIGQRWNNPIAYTINNTAYIYFDANPPIVTNTVFHNVKENFSTSIAEIPVGKNGLGVIAYPNPTSDNVTILLNELKAGQSYTLQVFNAAGMLVKERKNLKLLETAVDMTGLATGLYTYRVATTEGKFAAGRFVKQ